MISGRAPFVLDASCPMAASTALPAAVAPTALAVSRRAAADPCQAIDRL